MRIRMKVIGLFYFVLLFVFPDIILPASGISNLTITPAVAVPGSAVTIEFNIDVAAPSYKQVYFSAGFSEYDTGAGNPPPRCATDWVAVKEQYYNGIYARSNGSTFFYAAGNTITVTSYYNTNAYGPVNGGLQAYSWGSATTPSSIHVTIPTFIPPEYASGTYYLYVMCSLSGSASITYQCSAQNVDSFEAVTRIPVTVSGPSSPYKLNLQVYGQTSNSNYEFMAFKFINYSESGIRLSRLSYRYYTDSSQLTWIYQTPVPDIQVYRDNAMGGQALMNYDLKPYFNLTGHSMVSANCSTFRKATMYIEAGVSDPGSGNAAHVVLPAGGWAYCSSPINFGPSGGGNVNTYYYSQASELGFSFQEYKNVTLHLDGAQICEYTDASTQDLNMGEAPCAVAGTCGVIATATFTHTFTATQTPTQTQTNTFTFTATGIQTATFTATFTSTVPATDTPTFTFTATASNTVPSGPTATPAFAGNPNVELNDSYTSPDPASEYMLFTFKLEKGIKAKRVRIDVYNFAGRQVATIEETTINAGLNRIRMNLDKFAQGVYFYIIRVETETGQIIRYKNAKFLVAR